MKLTDMNPAVLQAKIIKVLAIIALVGIVLAGAYFQGRHDGAANCKVAIAKVAAAVAERRADNAVGATQRFVEYNTGDAALDTSVNAAIGEIRKYYAENPVTKLVKVPGKKDIKYVPTPGSCPDPVLDVNELHLFNNGNKRSDFDAGDSK